jgi:hypothetical protein
MTAADAEAFARAAREEAGKAKKAGNGHDLPDDAHQLAVVEDVLEPGEVDAADQHLQRLEPQRRRARLEHVDVAFGGTRPGRRIVPPPLPRHELRRRPVDERHDVLSVLSHSALLSFG